MRVDDFLDEVAAETGIAGSEEPIQVSVVSDVLGRDYGLSGGLIPIATEKDDTFRLEAGGRPYLVKVSPSSEAADIVDLQTSALLHLEEVAPELPVQRLVRTRAGGVAVELETDQAPSRTLRVFDFVPGTLLADAQPSAAQLGDAGAMLAKIGSTLAEFDHPREERLLLWDLAHFHRLRRLLDSVRDPGHRSLAERVMDEFEQEVVPVLGTLRRQVVHGDYSPYNVVVEPGASPFITGVIDFGDTVRTTTVFDIAVMTANQIGRDEHDPWAAAAAFIRGYRAERALDDTELATLRIAGLARLALRALVAEWRAEQSPDRQEYVMSHASHDWIHLAVAASTDRRDVARLLSAHTC
ncbi:hypothetical protein E1202_25445 [Saccharopolyspora karakumensis]|uniref:Hydroxylysine kinase n=1 Tax=Saccharopolyspora karakumensis TaxID=2530386 RepID=A0A4R5BF18_9PSEU|nr:phosphotransferase [Saccharopolyspora karakumensis]TDD83460.1 hypothetical protein E1202_25445 [Saccharopolyspora karakumensis]